MKRRNIETKSRRPVKKIKLYDGFYTSLVVYIKLLLLWTFVMSGDFLLEFRLEYLYPVYLLVHNSYEAYKFQGVAFTLLLLCIVISVNIICLGIIPSPWIFILGSLSVWSQVGWNLTPLGPLLLIPTLIYMDGKDLRAQPSEKCCPLAANCLGLPIVTLAFTLKSIVSTKLRQRTRDEVSRKNEILFQILASAGGEEPGGGGENGEVVRERQGQPAPAPAPAPAQLQAPPPPAQILAQNPAPAPPRRKSIELEVGNSGQSAPLTGVGSTSTTTCTCGGMVKKPSRKEECCYKLDTEVRRLRSELHSSKSTEYDLKQMLSNSHGNEKTLRYELCNIQGEHESLQLKYASLVSKAQEERQAFEKKLGEERRGREREVRGLMGKRPDCLPDCKRRVQQLTVEKEQIGKTAKSLEEKLARVERELQNVKSTLMLEQSKTPPPQPPIHPVHPPPPIHKDPPPPQDRLLSLLTALQEQNAHLESSLSAETRLKLDLFSALGEARRQLAIRDSMLKQREEELESSRSQVVELLAVGDLNRMIGFSSQQQQQQNLQQSVNQQNVQNNSGYHGN